MIVAPDFFDHWRTRMLVDDLGGDEMAPLYVQRLWAHCQVRKGVCFTMPAAGLKALCKFAGDAQLLEQSLIAAGFVARDASDIEVLKWAEYNSQLIAAWKNGKAGGRPKGSKTAAAENPPVSGGMADGSQQATQAKAIREDRSREEITIGVSSSSKTQHLVGVDDASRGGDPIPDCPHRELLKLFGEKAPSLPQPMPELWAGTKADNLRARWRWMLTAKRSSGKRAGQRYASTKAEAMNAFGRIFAMVEESDFLTGRSGAWHGCSLDWIVKQSNFDKVLQGNYENFEQPSSAMAGAI